MRGHAGLLASYACANSNNHVLVTHCTSCMSDLTPGVLQVVEDFAADNVVYLELRTTPKVLLLGVDMAVCTF